MRFNTLQKLLPAWRVRELQSPYARECRVRLGSFMPSALSFEDVQADRTLACRSFPLSNLEIVAELTGWPEERHYSRPEGNSSSNG